MSRIQSWGSMDISDDKFIRQINDKEIGAFRVLFERFYNYLVLYAMKRVQKREVAEDVVQEVFVAIWENTKKYNSFNGFRAFLYDSVQNRCLDYLKHKAVENRYVAYRLAHQDDEGEREYNLMQEEIYRELYLAVKELPDRCREVFELHLQGKKNEEIAELLSLSVLTVKTHKKNAVRFLKERLGNIFFLFVMMGIM